MGERRLFFLPPLVGGSQREGEVRSTLLVEGSQSRGIGTQGLDAQAEVTGS